MTEQTDQIRHLDRAISNMSVRRRILYFQSENRHILEEVVNRCVTLWDRLEIAPPPEEDKYAWLVKQYKLFGLGELYKPNGVLGSIQLKTATKSSTGQQVTLTPSIVTLTDFQVYEETDRKRMVKVFLDAPALRGALLLISSPHILIPEGFSGEIELISDSFLSERDIFLMLREQVLGEGGLSVGGERELQEAARQFVGLSSEQVRNVLEGIAGDAAEELHNGVYLSLIEKEKRAEVSKDATVRFIDVDPQESVAGLGNFTRWLKKRAGDFGDPAGAAKRGTPAPKGVLLCGVPGTGKTAMARETARILGAPLIQFDISRIQGSKLGESEARLRRYLDRISAFGSCVMLMDEIEKTFSVNDNTHEVKLAMLGLLLDWMQTRRANVLTFITANSITNLPPELLRDGRVSGRFFAFMPMRDDLTAIMRIKLRPLADHSMLNEDFATLVRDPNLPKSRLGEVFDRIAGDARSAKDKGEIRLPFMTGANLEVLIENTNRALLETRKPPYSLENYMEAMRVYAASEGFVPQGQSNLPDLVEMWIRAQERHYQDVSDQTVLPFNRFKDGKFMKLPEPGSIYDQFFQETLKAEIEKRFKISGQPGAQAPGG